MHLLSAPAPYPRYLCRWEKDCNIKTAKNIDAWISETHHQNSTSRKKDKFSENAFVLVYLYLPREREVGKREMGEWVDLTRVIIRRVELEVQRSIDSIVFRQGRGEAICVVLHFRHISFSVHTRKIEFSLCWFLMIVLCDCFCSVSSTDKEKL